VCSSDLSRRVDIQFVIAEDAYAAAVTALHRRLVEDDRAQSQTLSRPKAQSLLSAA
jgi:hypothetical protein